MDVIPKEVIASMVLNGWSPTGLIGHVFLHSGWIHLIGNMLFLWVFGNAICSNTNNIIYPFLYFGLGFVAAVTHILLDGGPAIGASGAINGIIGVALVMYPLNRVSVFWTFFIRGGTFEISAWIPICFWFVFDLWGAFSGGGHVAYWAHIGGLLGGMIFGMLALHFGWVQLTEYDNRSLLEIIKRQQRT
jgi:membrane associated rhomboid family serine protease